MSGPFPTLIESVSTGRFRLWRPNRALFAYTYVSHEGGFPLDDFPKIRAWIGRVKAQPVFIPIY